MNGKSLQTSALDAVKAYIKNLTDQSPYWRVQAAAWGIILMVLVSGGVLFAVLGLSGIFGGGTISYEGKGSPGPVVFRHYTHMWFKDGKYKDCRTCHDKLFTSQKYGTFVIKALQDSPSKKVHIGRDASTLYVPGTVAENEMAMVTYRVPRACATCAAGNCHDGKESHGRLDCLGCHTPK